MQNPKPNLYKPRKYNALLAQFFYSHHSCEKIIKQRAKKERASQNYDRKSSHIEETLKEIRDIFSRAMGELVCTADKIS
jgi:hypothetical protein